MAILLALAGCGVSASNEAIEADRSTTTSGDETITTTTSERGTTTTTEADRPVSEAALRALLPSAADIGPDYQIAAADEDEADDQSFEEAMRSACPEAAALMEDVSAEDESDIGRDFETENQRTISVQFNPEPRNMGEQDLDRVIDVINGCGTINVDSDDSVTFTLDFTAMRDDTFGDRGVTMHLQAVIASPLFGAPLSLNAQLRTFVVGPVSVAINAGDGIDDLTFETVLGDYGLIDTLSATLEAKVRNVVE